MSGLPPVRRLSEVDLCLLESQYAGDGPDWPWLCRFFGNDTARVWCLGTPVVAVAWFRRVADEAELVDIRVDAQARRAGLGEALLRAALAELAIEDVVLCHLEVRAGNSVAQHLYRRLGFVEQGRRRDYYPSLGADTGREDAILMRCQLVRGAAAL